MRVKAAQHLRCAVDASLGPGHLQDAGAKLAGEAAATRGNQPADAVTTHAYPLGAADRALADLKAGRFDGAAVLVP